VGLRSNGEVVAVGYNWGHHETGRCDVSDWTDIIQVSAGQHHTAGLESNGTVVAVGDNTYSQCRGVEDWTNIVQVEAGSGYMVGVKSDGTVVVAGRHGSEEDIISSWADIVQVSLTIGLKNDGTIIAAGCRYYNTGKCYIGWTLIS